MTRRFGHFVCIDWSGQAVARPRGIAIAHCGVGTAAPVLLRSEGGWSREAVLAWLIEHAEVGTDMLVGIDFSPALPFVDAGAYLPGDARSPTDTRGLWALVDAVCGDEPHLSAGRFCGEAAIARHFRRQVGAQTLTGDLFPPGAGRHRVCERQLAASGGGTPASVFNLVGAKQVGKSSLTGMRILHRLAGRIPFWPLDAVPARGPLLVEIYPGLAAAEAGRPKGRAKIRNAAALDAALDALGSAAHVPLADYDDHSTDAIVTAAWLRSVAGDDAHWHPAGLTPPVARTEGWTFGVH